MPLASRLLAVRPRTVCVAFRWRLDHSSCVPRRLRLACRAALPACFPPAVSSVSCPLCILAFLFPKLNRIASFGNRAYLPSPCAPLVAATSRVACRWRSCRLRVACAPSSRSRSRRWWAAPVALARPWRRHASRVAGACHRRRLRRSRVASRHLGPALPCMALSGTVPCVSVLSSVSGIGVAGGVVVEKVRYICVPG